MATYKSVNGNYVLATVNVTDTITLAAPLVRVVGNLSVTGNVSANFYLGDGRFLTNVVANIGSASKIQNGTSNVDIPVTNGNITFGVNLVNNVIVVAQTQTVINQTTAATSNVTGALIVAGGAGVGGDLYAGNIYDFNQLVLNVNSVIDGGTY